MGVFLLGLCALFIFILTLIFILTVYIYVQHRKYDHIPGPANEGIKGFFLGQIVERSKRKRHFSQMLCDWHVEYGHVYKIFLLHYPMVVTSDLTAIKTILGTGKFPKSKFAYRSLVKVFGQRFAGEGLITETNHQKWAKRRHLMNPTFHRGHLKSMTGALNETVNVLVEELNKVADGKTTVTMLDYMNRVTLDAIGKVAFAMDLNSLQNASSPFPRAIFLGLQGVSLGLNNPVKARLIPWAEKEFKNEVRQSIQLLRRTGLELIEKRMEKMKLGEAVPEDILTQVCKQKETDPDFDLEAALDDFASFFVAGQESTANTMSFVFLDIGRNPEVMQKLKDEVDTLIGDKDVISYEDIMDLEYCGMVVKESLRLNPPAGQTFREITTDDLEIRGYKIPKGSGAVVSTYSVSRMECYHPDALTFDPERFRPDSDRKPTMYTYFPFLIGPRNCIGQTFAQLEARLLLAKLIQKFDIQIDMNQSFESTENFTIKPKDGCRCTLTPRKK